MIRAEHACIIPVTLQSKGIPLGNRSFERVLLLFVCVFFPRHMCNKMSDVRLSNASPTVERVDARHPDNVKPPVRRNLFGRPDPQEIRRCAEATIQEEVQAFREKYNFDPVTDRPLSPRNYAWKEDRDPAEFYVRPPHQRREVDLSGDNNSQDAEGSGGRRTDRRADSGGSRKRRSGAAGPCSSESQSRKSRTDEDDDDDDEEQACGAAKQALTAAERPSRPDNIAEVQ